MCDAEKDGQAWGPWVISAGYIGAVAGFLVCFGLLLTMWRLKEGTRYEVIREVFNAVASPAGWLWGICTDIGLVSVHNVVGAYALIMLWYAVLGAIIGITSVLGVRLLVHLLVSRQCGHR